MKYYIILILALVCSILIGQVIKNKDFIKSFNESRDRSSEVLINKYNSLKKPKLRVGVIINCPPYSNINSKGEWEGFDIEMNKILLSDYDIEFVEVTNDSRIPMLKTNKIDLIGSSTTINEERSKQVDFLNPIIPSGYVELISLDSIKEKSKYKVGVVIGTVSSEYAETKLDKSIYEIIYYNTDDMIFQSLISNKVDMIMTLNTQLSDFKKKTNKNNFKILEKFDTGKYYSYAVKKGNSELRDILNKKLSAIDKSIINNLQSKYFN